MNGSKRVLVTGYGGFLGKEIVRQLLENGYKVRGVARGAYPDIATEAVRADLSCQADLKSLAKDCDAIIHTAALAGVWGPWHDYYSINTRATSNLIESAVHNNVKCFVHCSSPSVTFDARDQSGIDESAPYPKKWLCHYPHTKALAEQTVLQATKKTPLKACVLRPHLIWGEGDPHLFPRVISRAKQGKLRRVGTGRNLIDVVHVRNAARAHVLALERLLAGDDAVNGQAFFITDGNPIPCWDWISQILNHAKVKVPNRSISYTAAYRLGALLESGYFALRIRREPPMTRFVAAQLALEHYFAIDKAKRLLGYKPELDMMEKFLGDGL